MSRLDCKLLGFLGRVSEDLRPNCSSADSDKSAEGTARVGSPREEELQDFLWTLPNSATTANSSSPRDPAGAQKKKHVVSKSLNQSIKV